LVTDSPASAPFTDFNPTPSCVPDFSAYSVADKILHYSRPDHCQYHNAACDYEFTQPSVFCISNLWFGYDLMQIVSFQVVGQKADFKLFHLSCVSVLIFILPIVEVIL